jgi:hypothetical protein
VKTYNDVDYKKVQEFLKKLKHMKLKVKMIHYSFNSLDLPPTQFKFKGWIEKIKFNKWYLESDYAGCQIIINDEFQIDLDCYSYIEFDLNKRFYKIRTHEIANGSELLIFF